MATQMPVGEEAAVRSNSILAMILICILVLGLFPVRPAFGSEPSSRTGFLKMNTEPEGAVVEVDSGESGVSPTILEVLAGSRKVKVSREGYRSETLEAMVPAERVIRLQVRLSPLATLSTKSERRGKDEADMILIPEGEFLGGLGNGGSQKIYLKAFWIDKYEVTNAQYARFLQETGYLKPAYWEDPAFNQPSQPVVGVSWEDAISYARWAGKRLPSETEWEKAARGVDGRVYPWGNTWESNRCNSVGGQDGFDGTAPVGSFPSGASPFGVMDMAGNAWEWVADEPTSNSSTQSQEVRIGKGGSWANPSEGVKVIVQAKGNATLADCIIGFRCAMDGD